MERFIDDEGFSFLINTKHVSVVCPPKKNGRAFLVYFYASGLKHYMRFEKEESAKAFFERLRKEN